MPMSWSEALDEFEGRSRWIYADGGGTPTCGVGHALFTRLDAVGAFQDEWAEEDWANVKRMAPGLAAGAYEEATVCRLTDAQIDALKAADMGKTIALLGRLHPQSSAWPSGCRDAALDCLYNTGKPFPRMWSAMDAGDYVTAARESHRIERPELNGIQSARNQWARESILSACVTASI
jgi:GH24 family phage-related lysozyme (muramidase)